MKGISPVIATVLLLLMAVSAAGGAWVFYQRLNTGTAAQGQQQIETTTKGTSAFYVDIAQAYVSGGNLYLDISNIGSSEVTITSILGRNSTSTYTTCNSTSTAVPAGVVTTGVLCEDDYSLSSGKMLYLKIYFYGGSSKEVALAVG